MGHITIPLIVAAMGGPQAVLGWIAGAILALADGQVWAELGASMPGSGGTYLYLRKAFRYRTGNLHAVPPCSSGPRSCSSRSSCPPAS